MEDFKSSLLSQDLQQHLANYKINIVDQTPTDDVCARERLCLESVLIVSTHSPGSS